MKRVHIRTGLKQRLNDIIGQDSGSYDPASYPDADSVPSLTEWSVQSAMLDNVRRVVSAIVGGSPYGRPMQGLVLSASGSTINVSAGYGFTKSGNVIYVKSGLAFSSTPAGRYVYLIHKMAVVDGATYSDGKKTGFIGQSGKQNIVYDDLASSKKDDVSSVWSDVVVFSSSEIDSDNSIFNDIVYLGYVNGSVVFNSYDRGIPSSTETLQLSDIIVANLIVNTDATFNSPIDLLGNIHIGNIILTVTATDGDFTGHTGDITLSGITGLKVRKGLIVGTLP